jgi:hypothetical protein
MVVSGVGGALMESMGLMGWVFENSLGEVGRSFLDLLDLRWVTAPRLVFGMMCGVGSNPLRKRFRSCLALLA